MWFASTSSRACSFGASLPISSSKVSFGSSIIAHSSPRRLVYRRTRGRIGGAIPATVRPARSIWRGSPPSSAKPSAVARRRAGSIVMTTTLCPAAARPSAIAAEIVVLPTPPAPRKRICSGRATVARDATRLLRAAPRAPSFGYPRAGPRAVCERGQRAPTVPRAATREGIGSRPTNTSRRRIP